MDEWHVGDPEDWGDFAGVPDIPYMGYLNNDDDDKKDNDNNAPREPFEYEILSDKAWKLRNDGYYSDALDLINQSLDLSKNRLNYLRKAIILQDLYRFDESLEYYDKALAMHADDYTLSRKASCMLGRIDKESHHRDVTYADVDYVNEILKVLPKSEDNYLYMKFKGELLERLGDPIKSKICYYLAYKDFDEVNKADEQLKILKNHYETLILITATECYHDIDHFREGMIFDLIKEPYNQYDHDAIRVDYHGKTVGYVANSEETLIEGVESASDIKSKHPKKAVFRFLMLGTYHVAELINV